MDKTKKGNSMPDMTNHVQEKFPNAIVERMAGISTYKISYPWFDGELVFFAICNESKIIEIHQGIHVTINSN